MPKLLFCKAIPALFVVLAVLAPLAWVGSAEGVRGSGEKAARMRESAGPSIPVEWNALHRVASEASSAAGQEAPAKAAGPLEIVLDHDSRNELLSMARGAVNAAVSGEWVSFSPTANPQLRVRAGCFVTLKNRGELRGCIGRFRSDQPLWKTVRELAISAATADPRFASRPVKPGEVPALEIEISVLSPLRQVFRPLEEIRLGQDGIVVSDRGRSGTFLPQVATETGWSIEEFLGHCARDKAGLEWEGWQSPTARVYTYTAIIFSGKGDGNGEKR